MGGRGDQQYKNQQDGLTAYEAITKHKRIHLVVGFGELIHWQMAPAKPDPDKLDGDWRDGSFLGVMDVRGIRCRDR